MIVYNIYIIHAYRYIYIYILYIVIAKKPSAPTA